MADDANQPETQTPNPEAQPATGDAPKEKTYTEAEISAMVADRLTKQEKSLRKQLEAERDEAISRGKLEESERLKAEKGDLEKQLEQVTREATEARYSAQLAEAGFTKTSRIVKLLEDSHLKDGALDLGAIKADFAEYLPQTQKQSPLTPANPGGGGKGKPTSFFQALIEEQKAR